MLTLVKLRTTALLAGALCAACGDDDSGPAKASGAGGAGGTSGAGGAAMAEDAGGLGGASGGGSGGSGGTAMSADAAGAASPLSVAEQAEVKKLSPLPELPKNSTNRVADDAKAATLGQMLFFDKSYSGPLAVGDDGMNGALGAKDEAGKLSCASCHAGPGLDDQRSKPNTVSLGANWLGRNSLGLVNASYYKWVNWAGRFSAQWELPIAVVENANNMNGSRLRVAHLIFDKYRAEYEAVFGPLEPALGTDLTRFPAAGKPKANAMADDGPWEKMAAADREIVELIYANFGKALEAYMRKLVSRTSRFDSYVAGKSEMLTANEVAGLKVFVGKGRCIDCHAGPHMTDNAFHNLATPRTGERVPAMDMGRFGDIPPLLASKFNTAGPYSDDKTTGRLEGLTAMPPDDTKGQFRTPSLRNVGRTAPYFHAGQFATLADVVEHYDKGGGDAPVGTKDAKFRPLGLSATEKSDLVTFLKALDTDPLPAGLLMDTSKK